MLGIFNQFRLSPEQEVTDLFLSITIGAAGAPILARGKAVESIVRNSAGLYTVTLDRKWPAFLMAKFVQLVSVAQDLSFQVVSVNLSARTIQFVCLDDAVATDPSNGSTIYAQLTFKKTIAV